MREDSDRTARAMREAAEADISDRRRVSQQMREDQAATRRMEEKNYQILTGNLQRELTGLQAKGEQEQKQIAIDSKAAADMLETIMDFSSTAAEQAMERRKQQAKEEARKQFRLDLQNQFQQGRSKTEEENAALIAQNASVTSNRIDVLNKAEATGGADEYQTSVIEQTNPSSNFSLGLAQATNMARSGAFRKQYRDAEREAIAENGGKPLSIEQQDAIVQDIFNFNIEGFFEEGYPVSVAAPLIDEINNERYALQKELRKEETKRNNNQSLGRALQTFAKAGPTQKIIEFPVTYQTVLRHTGGNNREAWEFLKPSMSAVDEQTGEPMIDPDVQAALMLVVDGKQTTVGEHFTNSKGQPVGIWREILSDLNKNRRQWETQKAGAEKNRLERKEIELYNTVAVPEATNAQIADAQRAYMSLSNGLPSKRLENLQKSKIKSPDQSKSEASRVLAKPAIQITKTDVESVKNAMGENSDEYQAVKALYEGPDGQKQFDNVNAQKKMQDGIATIRGESDFSKAGLPGSQPAIIVWRRKVFDRALLYMGDKDQGYDAEEAMALAINDISAEYNTQLDSRDYSLPFARQILPGGVVRYPGSEKMLGDKQAALTTIETVRALKQQIVTQAKTGDPQAFGTIVDRPESIISADRMEYLIKNPEAPANRLERAALSLSNGMSLAELRNRQFAALGGKEEIFQAPSILGPAKIDAEIQRIVNDPGFSTSFKLNAINVASGNTEVYRNPSLMRAGSVFSQQGGTSLQSFAPQVSSVTFDTGQPGIDVFFENKQFPAVLNGKVKDIDYQINSDGSGYGHYVVIESIDPNTGQKVDVLYSHFSNRPRLQLNQTINQGQIIGIQGGSGSVQSVDGTISSIDFLEPAARGSKDMTPYSNYEALRNSIASQLQNN